MLIKEIPCQNPIKAKQKKKKKIKERKPCLTN